MWEYDFYSEASLKTSDKTLRASLNELGREGWELVSVTVEELSVYYYFKRPIKE